MRLGLTGGIGSGKSTLGALLQEQGALLLDADRVAHALTAPQGAAIAAIAQAFGDDFIQSDGAMDRERMRAHVFADASARARLEAIVHPLVRQELLAQADRAQAEGVACMVFDVPLLLRATHWRAGMHRVLVVDCSPATQIARVTARNGMTAEAVMRVLQAQISRSALLAGADLCVCNDGISLDELKRLARAIGTQFGL